MTEGDEEQLAIKVIAKLTDLEKQMAKASGITARAYREMTLSSKKATRQMEQDAARSAKRINQALATVGSRIGDFGKAFAAGFISTAALRSAQQLIDASTRIENALKVAGLSGEELTEVYDALFASAQQNAAPLESLVTLYGRLSLVQKELNVSQAELLGFSDNIALALRVSGQSASEASGALLQLSQALGGGVVRAEEFNSVLEGAPTIAQAVAAGLDEAGGSVSRLRNLVIEGKVSSEAFFRAFEAGAVTLQEKVAGSELTVSQQFVRLQNVMIDTAGKIDDATDASGRLGGGLEDLAATVQSFGATIVSVAESDVGTFIGKIADAYGQVSGLIKIMGGLPGVFAKVSQMNVDIMNGKPLGDTMSEDNIQNRIDQAFEDPAAPKTGRLPAITADESAPELKPIRLADYPVGGAKSGKTGGGAKRSSSGAASADRERESVEKLIKEMREELSLVGASDEAKRAAEATRRAGAAATEEERQQIVELNEALYQQEEAQRRVGEAADFFKDAASDAISDLIPQIETGNAALDRLVNSLIEAVAQAALLGKGPLAGLLGGGGGLGSLFGGGLSAATVAKYTPLTGLFAKGTDFAPGGPSLVGEKGPEIVNMPRGAQVIPNHQLQRGQPQNSGGKMAVDVGVSVDRNGNLEAYVKSVSRQQASGVAQQATRQGIADYHKGQERGGFGRTQSTFTNDKG